MKLGVYSITYLGIWYEGEGLPIDDMMRLLKAQGWEGVALDTKRPHAAPMDLSEGDRRRLRELADELALPIVAVAPNSDLASHVPEHLEAQICYVRECIKLARDLGSPICKIFSVWPGVVVRDGLAHYKWTFNRANPHKRWEDERFDILSSAVSELAKFAEDNGVILAMQNHGPVTPTHTEIFELIDRVDSPAFKACIDLPPEPVNDDPEGAYALGLELGSKIVHTHYYCDFRRDQRGEVELDWEVDFQYGEFVRGLTDAGYEGFMCWEFCHPVDVDGRRVDIEHVHDQTEMALEYMSKLREAARRPRAAAVG